MRLVGEQRSGAPVELSGEWLWRRGGGAPQVAVPMRRDLTREPGTEPHEPAAIYNAMMAPCIGYPVRGTIWYQGESNAGEPEAYAKLLPLLMDSWRVKSGNPDMAWGIVQLASFMPFVENEPAQGAWALLREAQFRGARAGKGGMISAIDLGDAADIHPRRKREVGERLAAWARNTVYGEDRAIWRGPELARAVRKGSSVVCRFDHAVGLQARGGELGGFALAGADGRFVWAKARLEGETVVVESADVAQPVEVAYAWQNNPERANLANGAYLPAVPFRAKVAAE
jgi:sialate O-acetylesterase